jgi:hypothetical protein
MALALSLINVNADDFSSLRIADLRRRVDIHSSGGWSNPGAAGTPPATQ